VAEVKHIVVSGPESTAKSNISEYLAERFNCEWVPEYARSYMQGLDGSYSYSDIENIARMQMEQYREYTARARDLVIFDTWLIITRVWFRVAFGEYPAWLDEGIKNLPVDLYLLCKPDIEWVPDPLRENGGEMRDVLFEKYWKEIANTGVSFEIVEGTGKTRFLNAEKFVQKHIY